ncbi:GIY-YIG nuclease family protein [Kosakonia radicincitans]|uniref:GIY-YIG nuclease family protein n=1 Tax=Kosakonia radicincitans TaxID=283686 RepID=UPI0011EFC74F|nr:GIY-YIG nuclease family protein [Kosakonia radicincitans]QEM90822.1 GIY-YIG nuclease family protein [Kosakonia radicincitans]
MNRLIEIGFIKVGYWQISEGILKYSLDQNYSDVKNNLYAFVCDGEVKYVGKTTRLLKNRMYHYSRPGPTQSTNIKNNANIRQMIDRDIAVDIFVLPDTGLMHYGQFHLNLAAGLEDSIINIINPIWNGNKSMTIEEDVIPESRDVSFVQASNGKTFSFNMANTYWSRGFFNVPVISKEEFGHDGEKIKIIFRDGTNSVIGMINRTANSSKSPRIMGGTDLRNHFQNSYKIGDIVSFEAITPHIIKLI